jgi:transcriptional regulatory protein LevR
MWDQEKELRKIVQTLTKKLRKSLLNSMKKYKNLSREELVEELIIVIEKRIYEFIGGMIKWTKKKKAVKVKTIDLKANGTKD